MDTMTVKDVGDWLSGQGFSTDVVVAFAGESSLSMLPIQCDKLFLFRTRNGW